MGATESTAADEAESSELVERRNRNIKRMDQAVRKRLRGGRGFSYNMKLIIRGERGTGKTALWRRLQGMSLTESYSPTPEIQTANINWSFKNLDEAVKVEVWDVVDGTDESDEKGQALGLNSSVVNVYQNTNAAIFMVNRNAVESFEYVKARISEVPEVVSVLVLINFRDQPVQSPSLEAPEDAASVEDAPPPPSEGTEVEPKYPSAETEESSPANQEPSLDSSTDDAKEQISTPQEPVVASEATDGSPDKPRSDSTSEAPTPTADPEESQAGAATQKEPSSSAPGSASIAAEQRVSWETMSPEEVATALGGPRAVLCFECSMSNCFGLKLLYTYLNIPFLALKKANMLQALKVLDAEALAAGSDMAQLVSASSYEGYVEHLSKTKAPARVPRPRVSKANNAGDTNDTAVEGSGGKRGGDEQVAEGSTTVEPVRSAPEKKDVSEETSESSSQEVKPQGPPAVAGVDDEMSLLNQRALKSSAVSTFFDDDDDDDDQSPLPAAKEAVATTGKESTTPAGKRRGGARVDENSDGDDAIPSTMASKQQPADDDSSDDEFYSQPRFGISAVAAPPPAPIADPPTHAADPTPVADPPTAESSALAADASPVTDTTPLADAPDPDSPPITSPSEPHQRPPTAGTMPTSPNGASSNHDEEGNEMAVEATFAKEISPEEAGVEIAAPSNVDDADIVSCVEPGGLAHNACLEAESDDDINQSNDGDNTGGAESPVRATAGGESVEHISEVVSREDYGVSAEPAVGESQETPAVERDAPVDDAVSPASGVDSSSATAAPPLDDPPSLPSTTESFLSEEPKRAQPEKVSDPKLLYARDPCFSISVRTLSH